jgi:hypothetical protein
MKTKTHLLSLPFAFLLSFAATACPSSDEDEDNSPPAPAGGPGQPGPGAGADDGGVDGESPAEPSQAVLSACSVLLDAYKGECGKALDTSIEGGVCGTGYTYSPACEGDLLELLECLRVAEHDCYEPGDIVLPYECDRSDWSFQRCVDPSLPPFEGRGGGESEGDDEPSPTCTGSASNCDHYSPGDCAAHGCSLDLGSTTGTSDDECTGMPTACDDISSEEACEAQAGCTWEP